MKLKLIVVLLFSQLALAQTNGLTNKKLIEYFSLVNEAELKITENNLSEANVLYKKAFKTFKEPHAKDMYNSMKTAFGIKDWKHASQQYRSLKCMEFPFEDVSFPAEFDSYRNKSKSCKNKIDYDYRKKLDSLVVIDQKYRNMSGGNYTKYKKEITTSDSIASIKLLKLIQEKGFPNEYELGLKSADNHFFHNFYLIIWHQLASNTISPQRVNFTNEILKAVNEGKINPENAGILIDLNNNSTRYKSELFTVHELITLTANKDNPFEALKNKQYESDCCYLHPSFRKENRDQRAVATVKELDSNREKIGLSSIDDELKKIIFSLNNKDYVLVNSTIAGHQFADPEQGKMMFKNFIKIKKEKN